MKLIIDIPDTQYHNIMDFKMLCLGRIPYKGIIRHSIIAIQNGIQLEDYDVLDKIRAEIQSEQNDILWRYNDYDDGRSEALEWVLEVIDKYRNEVSE